MFPVFLGILWLCTRLIISTQANTGRVCGKVVDNTLKSPGYPYDYLNNTDCIYVVPIPPDMDMKITFKDFSIEEGPSCRYDHLMISSEHYKYGVYCGERTGHTVLVNGSYVVIRFHSDDNVQRKGFLLFFTAVPIGNRTTTQQPENACGQVVNNTLKSPCYPNNYQSGTDCLYVIPIPQGTRLNIIFEEFDLEFEPNCGFDYLMITAITNGNNLNLGKHCGVKTGKSALVTGDYAVLTFHSDENRERKGFLLFFRAIPEENFTPAVSPSQISEESNITRFQNESISSTAPSTSVFKSTDANSLSTLVVVIISVSAGVTVGFIGLAVPCYIWRRRRKRRKGNEENTTQG